MRLPNQSELLRDGTAFIKHNAGDFSFQATDQELEALDVLTSSNNEWESEPLFVEIHAIHGETPTLNHTLFPNASLMGDGKTTGYMSHLVPYQKPMILDHNSYSVNQTVGRCDSSAFVIDATGSGVITCVYAIHDSEAKAKILSGQYMTTSVGAKTDHFYCTICGVDWLSDDWDECDHILGNEYDGVTAALKIGNYWNLENSFVVVPADQRAGVKRINLAVGLGYERFSLNEQLIERLGKTTVAIPQLVTNSAKQTEEEPNMDQELNLEVQEPTAEIEETEEVILTIPEATIHGETKQLVQEVLNQINELKETLTSVTPDVEEIPQEEPVQEEVQAEPEVSLEEQIRDIVQKAIAEELAKQKPETAPVPEELQEEIIEGLSMASVTAPEQEEVEEPKRRGIPGIPGALLVR